MDKQDIIRMAREAGLGPVYGYESIERFAALIAEREREACAKVVEQTKWSNWFQADCAEAIRARGQA